MAPAYTLKKSHLSSLDGAACCPSSSSSLLLQQKPAVAHLIKDLEVDNARQELTLAQRLPQQNFPPSLSHARHRLGLVEAPPPLLTLEVLSHPSFCMCRAHFVNSQQWEAAEQKARGRNDSALPCPICKEQFKHEEQVFSSARLLSPHCSVLTPCR
jgi:hypothetical protein